jgi:hypothetical protein
MFNESFEYRTDTAPRVFLGVGFAEYIKQFDLVQEKDWHKALNTLGVNNSLQASIMDPDFDDICTTQSVQTCIQEFIRFNALTLQRIPDMLRRKIDQIRGWPCQVSSMMRIGHIIRNPSRWWRMASMRSTTELPPRGSII